MNKVSKSTIYLTAAFALTLGLNIVAVVKIVSLQNIVENLSKTVQQEKISERSEMQRSVATEAQVLDVSSWRTYRNEKYGLEFKYPLNTNLYSGNYGYSETFAIDIEEKNIYLFEYSDNFGGTYIFDSQKKNWTPSPKTNDSENEPVAIQTSFEVYRYIGGSGFCVWDAYFIPFRMRSKMIQLEYSVCGDPPRATDITTHEKNSSLILSTFKFINISE